MIISLLPAQFQLNLTFKWFNRQMRWIYISPHLDDAILSCGGLIWEQTRSGLPVEIWTVTSGYPPPDTLSILAHECHAEWGTETAEQTVSTRRSEDRTASKVLGAIAYYFDILDCIYRRSSQGDWLYPDVFVPPHSAEAALPDEIAALLRPRLKPDDIVVSPLAIGRHVDHVLVREAVERLGRPLLYYADIPYTLNHPEILEQATDGLSATFYSISNEGLRAWQDGITAYASQISMLFITKARMQTPIRSYWQKNNGIYLWQ